ncbi:MAG: hypothetical protein R3C97_00355 [Geminicoccaceae bacterium]
MKDILHRNLAGLLACALLGGQIALGLVLERERARPAGLLPPPPTAQALLVRGLGDRQLAYRMAALELQEAGDGGGVITPLLLYDYDRVAAWLDVVDRLDREAEHVMVMATFYFALATDPAKVRRMVEFVVEAFERRPEKRWRFLAHAAFLARFRLHDRDYALAIARRLASLDIEGLPIWTKQMPAFVLAEMGEDEAAADLMNAILEDDRTCHRPERRLMTDFIDRHRRTGLPTDDLRRRKP